MKEKANFLRESEEGTVGTRPQQVGNSIYMASAAPGKDDGPKSQPSSEPVPHSAELI